MKSVAVFVCVALAACATEPVTDLHAKFVQGQKVLDRSFVDGSRGKAAIVVKRDSGLLGSGCSATVLIGGNRVALLDPGEAVMLQLPEGDFVVGAANNGGLCGSQIAEVKVAARNASLTKVRIGYGASMAFTISETAY